VQKDAQSRRNRAFAEREKWKLQKASKRRKFVRERSRGVTIGDVTEEAQGEVMTDQPASKLTELKRKEMKGN